MILKMIIFSVITYPTFSSAKTTSLDNLDCAHLAEHIHLSLDAELETLSNIAHYMDSNSKNWYNIDSVVKKILASSDYRRNYSYTGAAWGEGKKSERNAQATINHRASLIRWRNDIVKKVADCIK